MKEEIKIRLATRSDVDFISQAVMQSIEYSNESVFDCLRNLCILDDTLYSYCHALIAEVNGNVAGCIVAYPGEIYKESRDITFDIILQKTGLDLTPNEIETYPGEFYIDSLYVDSEYRGLRIGEKLIKKAIEYKENNTPTLIVDNLSPGLQKYYSECGFMPTPGVIENFGRTYTKMIYDEKD
jgi:ribosomal protein S18 acetylase RimI-like enzyme